jgi:Mg-chelatase subunit ChlD
VPQRVEAAREAGAVSVVLVLDTSGSLAGQRLEQLILAVQKTAEILRPADEVHLVTFAVHTVLHTGSARAPAAIRAALSGVMAGGTTAIWDGLASGLALAAASDARNRSLVLLFTDGLENASWLSEKAAGECVDRSDAVVYLIRPPEAPPAGALRALVQRSGGSVVDASDFSELPERFVSVLEEFRARYRLTYEPMGVGTGDGWHRLGVRIKGRRADVRARDGYFAGKTR